VCRYHTQLTYERGGEFRIPDTGRSWRSSLELSPGLSRPDNKGYLLNAGHLVIRCLRTAGRMNVPESLTASIPAPIDYLSLTSLNDGIFLIGSLDSGVTIFNQQIRALNLIWALDRTYRLRSASAIAVVGGGIAGLTAAMALRKIFSLDPDPARRTITVFEKRSVLCPLQRGCATRWVHPHIYDWPKPGSTNPSAGLPIMNWREGRASDVATTIIGEWEAKQPDEPKVDEWRNLRYIKIHHAAKEVEWVGEQFVDGSTSPQVRGDKQKFDIIILAIGFGEECPSSKYPVVSYWRNETHGQPDLSGRQQRYLISGTGDGGLIDLLRLRIADFREDQIGLQLAPEREPRYKAIQELRNAYYEGPLAQRAELFDRARDLGRKFDLIHVIKKRLRADTVASLQIKNGQRVSDAFGGKSSFLNRFLVSLLFEAGGFSPRFGDLDSSVDMDAFDGVIVRHGTNNLDHLKSIFSEDISKLLTTLQEKRAGTSVPQNIGFWETGWPLDRKSGSGPGSPKRDYVPEATIAVSSAFVSALAPVFSRPGSSYRATLHRVVAMHGRTEVHLQQIAHYHGPRAGNGSGVVGRLFKVQDAAIGLAARTGRVLMTQALDQSDDESRRLLCEDMRHLNGDGWDPQRMASDVAAVFACPLIRLIDSGSKGIATREVVAVLFADSTEARAFDEETVTEIVAACEEFGRYLQRVAQGAVPELISVKSRESYALPVTDGAVGVFDNLSILKPSTLPPPRVAIEYLNLEWRVA
jgi:hypothetical protein